MERKRKKYLELSLCCVAAAMTVQGCGASSDSQKIEIEIVQYKPCRNKSRGGYRPQPLLSDKAAAKSIGRSGGSPVYE